MRYLYGGYMHRAVTVAYTCLMYGRTVQAADHFSRLSRCKRDATARREYTRTAYRVCDAS